MIPTPLTHHLDFENIYEPAEDSFLLLDALEQDLVYISQTLKPTICVEIGSGSGIISSALAASLSPMTHVIACDINPEACKGTKTTSKVNQVHLDVLELDFVKFFPLRSQCIDLLVCNPPYVATSVEESRTQISASWAGGSLGRHLTDTLITRLPQLLSEDGCAYIVLEQCNRPQEVQQMAQAIPKLETEIILSRRAGREHLQVLKIRNKSC